jgi:charged multivesicular body protein 2B
MNFFSKKPTAKEVMKDTKKTVKSSQRDLDREVRELEREEARVLADIKKRAKVASGNNDPTLRILAKQLVQLRANKTKLFSARANLGAMGMKATAMSSQVSAAEAMKTVGGAMAKMNKTVDIGTMQKTMAEFSKQNEMMDLREDLIDDALIDAFDADEEEEADELTNQVLAGLGLELDGKMKEAPSTQLPSTSQGVGVSNEAVEEEEEDAAGDEELRARLKAL